MKRMNIWAVLVTSVAIMLFGMLWYGFAFFDIWADGWGVVASPEPPHPLSLIYNFLSGLIYVAAFSFLLDKLNALNLKEAVGYGLLISLTFIIPGLLVLLNSLPNRFYNLCAANFLVLSFLV